MKIQTSEKQVSMYESIVFETGGLRMHNTWNFMNIFEIYF